jgi:ketosteroid isomerase-like protein
VASGNVERIEEVYAHWAEGDFRGVAAELFDQHVLFLQHGFPDPGPYHGVGALRDFTKDFLEPWSRVRIKAEELIEAGDTVVVAVVQRAVGEGSGASAELRYFAVWSFRGDRVIRLENFRERAQALDAAGLRA